MWIGTISSQEPTAKNRLNFSGKANNFFDGESSTTTAELIGVATDINDQISHSFHLAQTSVPIYGACQNDYCNQDDVRRVTGATVDTSYARLSISERNSFSSLSKCAAHRRGVLCGQCREGYGTTLYDKVRQKI